MKIKKLRLRGWTGIKRGLGLNEIEVDFSKANGLIALAGQNGTGKSSLIENLSPFNRLASRSGALFQHVFTRDAERELTFEYQGHEYRTLLKIDAQSGKSEGFIWRDGESLVNGKISAYAKAVAETFGSPELFYNSVFCSQNATKLSDMTTGELKNLFAEFLRLDRLQAYEETVKQMINLHSGKASQVIAQIAVLEKKLEGAPAITGSIEQLQSRLSDRKDYVAEAHLKYQLALDQRGTIKETIARNEVFVSQVHESSSIIAKLESSYSGEEKEINSRLDDLRIKHGQLKADIALIDAMLAESASIHAAKENKKALEELIETISANYDCATESVVQSQAVVTALEKEIAELKAQVILPEKDFDLIRLNSSVHQVKNQIAALEKQLHALEVRDPSCVSTTCSFITSALSAKDELPGLKDILRDYENAKARRESDLIALAAEAGRIIEAKESDLKHARLILRDASEAQADKRQRLAVSRLELNQYQNVEKMLSDLAVAASKKEDRALALSENITQGTAIAEAWRVKKEGLMAHIAEQKQKHSNLLLQIDTRAADMLDVIEYEILTLSRGIVAAERDISEISSKILTFERELAGISEAEDGLTKAQENRTRIITDVAEWTYLRNACGKNGLQAMEIDGAAPLITGYANSLLSQSFGSLYTVKFRTQDDEGKECLDIVTISEDGEEVLLDNLSGGQKTWILMALRLAMTLLSKEKSGRNFQTAMFDELDGALDSENAVNFISMYKSFMDIGHFDAIPFISHKVECRNMADHVLMFEAGKNPYWN